MDKFLEIFKRDIDDCYSLIRIVAGISTVTLIGITIAEFFGLVIQHYNDFATFTGGCLALAVGNKFVDFKGMVR